MIRKLLLGVFVAMLMALPMWSATPAEAQASCLFFTETGGGQGGYSVCDDEQANFRTAFETWGLQKIGYPISQRYERAGFVTQAFQKAIMQWRSDGNYVALVNIFDDLHNDGFDQTLLETRQTPLQLPAGWDGEGLSFAEVVAKRQALLDVRPALRDAYFAAGDPLTFYGLPTSEIQDMGNHHAIRLQRAVLQEWKEDVPWAGAGQVTIANGGDIAKELGALPAEALTPKTGAPALEPTATPPPAPEPTATTPPVTNLNPAGFANLGELVEGSGYSLAAVTVEDPTPHGLLYSPKAGTKLVGLELIVGNVSGKRVTSNVLRATLIDTNGSLYEPELAVRDGQLALEQLEMGNRVKGWAAFEVPEGVIPAGIRYEFSGFPEIILQTGLFTADGQRTANPNLPLTASGTVQRNVDGAFGSQIQRNGYSLTASAVENPATPGVLYTPKAGTKLVAIEVTLGNVSGETVSSNLLRATLIDTNGYLYSPELASRSGGQIDLVDLTPGTQVTGWIPFEVPADITPDRIRYEFEGYPRIDIESDLK